MRTLWSISLFVLLLLICSLDSSFARRQHGSHEHGKARLNMVIESNRLTLEFEAPAHDTLGFESKAKSSSQKKKLAETIQRLEATAKFLITPEAAECKQLSAKAEQVFMKDDLDHDHGHSARHSEMLLKAEFNCKKIGSLGSVDFAIFKLFPGLKQVQVVVVGPKGQDSKTLQPGKTKLILAPRLL